MRHRMLVALGCFGLFCWSATGIAQTVAVTAADLVGRARTATRFESLAATQQSFQARGSSQMFGVDGEYTLIFDANGNFAESITGRINTQTGHDGTTAWEIDRTGCPRKLELGDQNKAVGVQWVRLGAWLNPKLSLQCTRRQDRDDAKTQAVHITHPTRPIAGIVGLDRENGLPRYFEPEKTGAARDRVEFSDWQEYDGGVIPMKLVAFTLGEQERAVTIDDVSAAPAFFRSPYELVAHRPDDTTFEPDIPPELDCTRMPSGHLLVRPTIEGESLGWFVLDTGAGVMTLDPKAADEIGLARFGQLRVQGVGGAEDASFRTAASLELGPVTMSNPVFVEFDHGSLSAAFGRRIAGIIGHDLYQRCVVELDGALGRVALHDPQEYEAPATVKWDELILYGRLPCVRARFEGDREAIFRLDTGAGRQTVTFHAPLVEECNLLDGRKTRNRTSGGVGGNISVKTGSIDFFELAGHRFENPNVEFATQHVGAFADSWTGGNVGGVFLSQFQIILDYGRARIAFVPREDT